MSAGFNPMAGYFNAMPAAGGAGMLSSLSGALANPALLPATVGGSLYMGRRDRKKQEKEAKEAEKQAMQAQQMEAFARNIQMLGQFFNEQNANRQQAIQGALRR